MSRPPADVGPRTCLPAGPSGGSSAVRPTPAQGAYGADNAKREQSDKRGAPAKIRTVLTVEGRGVPTRVGGGGVALAAGVATTALAPPDHGLPLGGEAVPMAEDPTAQHDGASYGATWAYAISPRGSPPARAEHLTARPIRLP
ncbi:hypothetical protein GCM10009872_44150 [Actinopolymorpha rutila]